MGYDHVRLRLLDHDHFCYHPSDPVILELFCKVEPYIRRKFLEEQMRICQSHFFVISVENKKSSFGQRPKSIPDLIYFEGEFR